MSVEVKESAPKPTYLDVSKFYREDHFKVRRSCYGFILFPLPYNCE